MQISIRSYLTMGTAAVVGAGAIAMAPALPASGHIAHLSSPVVADVTLAGSSFSLSDIVGLIGDSGLGGGDFSLSDITDLLGNIGGDFSLADITDLLGNIGGDFSLADITDLLGNIGGDFSLPNLSDLLGNLGGNFSLPDIFNLFNGGLADLLPSNPLQLVNTVVREVLREVRPLLVAAAGDILKEVGSAFTGVFIGPDSIPRQIIAAVAGVPAVFKAALSAVRSGDFGLALTTISAGLIAPITAVGKAVKTAVAGLTTYVVGQVADFATKVPAIVMSAIEAAIGGAGAGAATLASVPAAAAVSEVAAAPVVEVSEPAVAASSAPRAAASVREDAPVAASAEPAEQAALADSPAPQAEEAAAPVQRPRVGAVRSAIADAVANGPAVTSRPKPTLRGDRGNTERPKAAAASRS